MGGVRRDTLGLRLLAALPFLLINSADATIRYWAGPAGAEQWSDTSNWSTSVGGPGGATLPTSLALLHQSDGLDRQVVFDLQSTQLSDAVHINATGTGTITFDFPTGTLTTQHLHAASTGTGTVVQTGGAIHLFRDLTIGELAGSAGDYALASGQLSVSRTAYIGRNGSGSFLHTADAAMNADQVWIGANPGAFGLYTLSGGTISVAGSLLVGFSGTGEMVQSGGAVSAMHLVLGADRREGNTGTYHLTGGQINVQSSFLVGQKTDAEFIQDAGNVHTIELSIGLDANVDGRRGEYLLRGGGISSSQAIVGRRGDGGFTQTGGVHTVAGDLVVGLSSDLSNSVEASYVMSGGELSAERLIIGRSFAGRIVNVEYTQDGGKAEFATEVVFADGTSAARDYTMDFHLMGGTLATPLIRRQQAAPSFHLTGGTLSTSAVDFDLLNEGSTLQALTATGLITVNGDYDQRAGTLAIGIGGNEPGTNQSQIHVNGVLSLDGALQIDWISGFIPEIGQSFDVGISDEVLLAPTLALAFISPLFTGELSIIPLNSGPDAGREALRLTMLTIPEPSSVALLGLLLLALMRRRRGVGRWGQPSHVLGAAATPWLAR